MSWVKTISDSITSNAPMKEAVGLIQGGISAVTVQVQRAIDAKKSAEEINTIMGTAVESVGSKLQTIVSETDPDDYALLMAMLRITLRCMADHVDADDLALAIVIEKKIQTVTVVLPRDLKGGTADG